MRLLRSFELAPPRMPPLAATSSPLRSFVSALLAAARPSCRLRRRARAGNEQRTPGRAVPPSARAPATHAPAELDEARPPAEAGRRRTSIAAITARRATTRSSRATKRWRPATSPKRASRQRLTPVRLDLPDCAASPDACRAFSTVRLRATVREELGRRRLCAQPARRARRSAGLR